MFFRICTHHKMSTIIDAVKRNDTQSLLLLIQSGGDVNEKDGNNVSMEREQREDGERERERERERRVLTECFSLLLVDISWMWIVCDE